MYLSDHRSLSCAVVSQSSWILLSVTWCLLVISCTCKGEAWFCHLVVPIWTSNLLVDSLILWCISYQNNMVRSPFTYCSLEVALTDSGQEHFSGLLICLELKPFGKQKMVISFSCPKQLQEIQVCLQHLCFFVWLEHLTGKINWMAFW